MYINIIKTLLIIILISISNLSIARVNYTNNQYTDFEYQKKILFYVNEYRKKHHLSPLKMNNEISMEATRHSKNMASHATPFGHNKFNERIKRLYKQCKKCNGGAENVAYYRLDPKKLVDAWISSRGHRRNIEGNYNYTGIGIAHGKKGWGYFTQIFLRSDSGSF